jgi:hypothetical protein
MTLECSRRSRGGGACGGGGGRGLRRAGARRRRPRRDARVRRGCTPEGENDLKQGACGGVWGGGGVGWSEKGAGARAAPSAWLPTLSLFGHAPALHTCASPSMCTGVGADAAAADAGVVAAAAAPLGRNTAGTTISRSVTVPRACAFSSACRGARCGGRKYLFRSVSPRAVGGSSPVPPSQAARHAWTRHAGPTTLPRCPLRRRRRAAVAARTRRRLSAAHSHHNIRIQCTIHRSSEAAIRRRTGVAARQSAGACGRWCRAAAAPHGAASAVGFLRARRRSPHTAPAPRAV